jgi:hypothetical protein
VERLGTSCGPWKLDSFAIGAERTLECPCSAEQGLGDRGGARRGAEPGGALGIQELGVGAEECRGGESEREVECGEDRELGCGFEVVGGRDLVEGCGGRRIAAGS